MPDTNFFIEIEEEDVVQRIEVYDPTYEGELTDYSLMPLALGNEEFSPGTYTRTLYYSRTAASEFYELQWNVKFTIYTDSTMPRITYVSGFTKCYYFPTTTAPYIRRASATSSSPATAYAYARDIVKMPDGRSTTVKMYFYLYNDDSATIQITPWVTP